jgi:Domain of unknown function (DUF3362).
MQRALLQFRDPMKYDLVHEALVEAHREDLIGIGPKCLIKPRGVGKGRRVAGQGSGKSNSSFKGNFKSTRGEEKSTGKQSRSKDKPIGRNGKVKDKPVGKQTKVSGKPSNRQNAGKSVGKRDIGKGRAKKSR